MQRFRGGLVFTAHRLLYHSTLGLRVTKKKKKGLEGHPVAVVDLVVVHFRHPRSHNLFHDGASVVAEGESASERKRERERGETGEVGRGRREGDRARERERARESSRY